MKLAASRRARACSGVDDYGGERTARDLWLGDRSSAREKNNNGLHVSGVGNGQLAPSVSNFSRPA